MSTQRLFRKHHIKVEGMWVARVRLAAHCLRHAHLPTRTKDEFPTVHYCGTCGYNPTGRWPP